MGQHFLVDQGAAQRIVAALNAGPDAKRISALEIGPGMGVLTQYLLKREDVDLKMVELDEESVNYLLTHFPGIPCGLPEAEHQPSLQRALQRDRQLPL